MGRRGYGDTFPDTPPNERNTSGFDLGRTQLQSVGRITDAEVADAQRGLTHLAALNGWTVDESRMVWQALGVDRRVA